mgnify:CR=1 FL=1
MVDMQLSNLKLVDRGTRIADVGVIKDLATHDIDLTSWLWTLRFPGPARGKRAGFDIASAPRLRFAPANPTRGARIVIRTRTAGLVGAMIPSRLCGMPVVAHDSGAGTCVPA